MEPHESTSSSSGTTPSSSRRAKPHALSLEGRELGGAAALVAATPFPWHTTALWAVLVGVLVVTTMAVRARVRDASSILLTSARRIDNSECVGI